MKRYATVDEWFAGQDAWVDECAVLRTIVLATGLEETTKWGQPTYMHDGRNVVIVSHMKDGAVVSFLKGALLDDPDGRLVVPGQSRETRFMRFASMAEIEANRAALEDFLAAAIANEAAGRSVPGPKGELDLVAELADRIEADATFAAAWDALTPGRKRGWNIHFGKAKRSATRVSRIEAATERILRGKGIFDCICGHSKRPPRCDGSHKHVQ